MQCVGDLISPAATFAFGQRLAALLREGDALLLSGELGAGKTTLVRAVCAGLGVEMAVTSPTYVIAHEYVGTGSPVLHLDAYRLSGPEDLYDLGLEDAIPGAITLIEWGNRVASSFPNALRLTLLHDHVHESVRRINLEMPASWSARGANLCGLLSRAQEVPS